MGTKKAAAIVAAILVSGKVGAAQSLAEAAAQAEEQRKSTGKATKVYTDETLLRRDGYESLVADHYLLEEHWEPYMYARMTIMQQRTLHADLDQWLMRQEAGAGGRYELETAYRSHSTIVGILDKWHISARDYFMTDASYELASEDLKTSWTQRIVLTDTRKANVDFIREKNLAPPYGWSALNDAQQTLNFVRRSRK